MNKEYNGYIVNYVDNFNKKHITYLKTYSEVKTLESYLSPNKVQYEPIHLSKDQLNPDKEGFLDF